MPIPYFPYSKTIGQALPPDVAELLRRIAMGGWKSDNRQYITDVARGLCAAYGIPFGESPELTSTFLDQNTAALVEWLNDFPNKVSKESKLFKALVGNLSEEAVAEHYNELIRVKTEEIRWKKIIQRVKSGSDSYTGQTGLNISIDKGPDSNPTVKTLRWLEEQFQTAKDVTYATARQAIAENLQAVRT